jgi:hypothetical protein
MRISPDQVPENVDFAAREIADAPIERRLLMLEGIAMALTRRIMQDHSRIGAREISIRVTRFIDAVRQKAEEIERSRTSSS